MTAEQNSIGIFKAGSQLDAIQALFQGHALLAIFGCGIGLTIGTVVQASFPPCCVLIFLTPAMPMPIFVSF